MLGQFGTLPQDYSRDDGSEKNCFDCLFRHLTWTRERSVGIPTICVAAIFSFVWPDSMEKMTTMIIAFCHPTSTTLALNDRSWAIILAGGAFGAILLSETDPNLSSCVMPHEAYQKAN